MLSPFDKPMRSVPSPFGLDTGPIEQLLPYVVGGNVPTVVLDWENNFFYYEGAIRDPEVDLIAHGGLATVTNFEGLLRYRGHNILENSKPTVATVELQNNPTVLDTPEGLKITTAGDVTARARALPKFFQDQFVKYTFVANYLPGTSPNFFIRVQGSGVVVSVVANAITGAIVTQQETQGTLVDYSWEQIADGSYVARITVIRDNNVNSNSPAFGPGSTTPGDDITLINWAFYRNDYVAISPNPDNLDIPDLYFRDGAGGEVAPRYSFDKDNTRTIWAEDEVTNNMLWTQKLDEVSSWPNDYNLGVALTPEARLGPDGLVSMWQTQTNNLTSGGLNTVLSILDTFQGTTFTQSVYVAEGTGLTVEIEILFNTTSGDHWVRGVWDWVGGVPVFKTFTNNNLTMNERNPLAEPVGNGIYRLSFTYEAPEGPLAHYWIYFNQSPLEPLGRTGYLYNPQAIVGDSSPHGAMVGVGSRITTIEDTYQYFENFNNILTNPGISTFYVKYITESASETEDNYIVQFWDPTNGCVDFYRDGPDKKLKVMTMGGGAPNLFVSTSDVPHSQFTKAALSFQNVGNFGYSLAMNGTVEESGVGANPIGNQQPYSINVGSNWQETGWLDGGVATIIYYPQDLSDVNLVELTTL